MILYNLSELYLSYHLYFDLELAQESGLQLTDNLFE
jgi:hypothetical protein